MSEKKHHPRQRVHPSTPQCDGFEALRRVFERCIKEKQHMENRVKQMEEEKTQVVEKHQDRQSNYQKFGGTTPREAVRALRDGGKRKMKGCERCFMKRSIEIQNCKKANNSRKLNTKNCNASFKKKTKRCSGSSRTLREEKQRSSSDVWWSAPNKYTTENRERRSWKLIQINSVQASRKRTSDSGLRVMFNKVLQRNAQLQKEMELQEATYT